MLLKKINFIKVSRHKLLKSFKLKIYSKIAQKFDI